MNDSTKVDYDEFDQQQDQLILDRYRTMAWNDEQSENAVIPCPRCDGKRLSVYMTSADEAGVSVVMTCSDCGHFPIHLAIQQQRLHSASPYMKLVTD